MRRIRDFFILLTTSVFFDAIGRLDHRNLDGVFDLDTGGMARSQRVSFAAVPIRREIGCGGEYRPIANTTA
jgi:hypothetical protein